MRLPRTWAGRKLRWPPSRMMTPSCGSGWPKSRSISPVRCQERTTVSIGPHQQAQRRPLRFPESQPRLPGSLRPRRRRLAAGLLPFAVGHGGRAIGPWMRRPGLRSGSSGSSCTWKLPAKKADADWYRYLEGSGRSPFAGAYLHLVAVCELNRETWKFIRKETDDDHEWLPNAKQTDQPRLAAHQRLHIDAWPSMMNQWEGLLLARERLLPEPPLCQWVTRNHPAGQGLNLEKAARRPADGPRSTSIASATRASMDRCTGAGNGKAAFTCAGRVGGLAIVQRALRLRLRGPAELRSGSRVSIRTKGVRFLFPTCVTSPRRRARFITEALVGRGGHQKENRPLCFSRPFEETWRPRVPPASC